MPERLLRFDGFSYRYAGADSDALCRITLAIEPGELVVLAGRSGSGKTTLLRAACGLVPHFHGGEAGGRLEVGGLDVREHGPAELGRAVGFVAQEPESQVVSTTVRAELELPLELRGEGPAARARAVEEVALALGIPHLLSRTTETLSGGELQRVALAAALAPRPPLVLLDEPTSQLDPVAGDELVWLLRRLNEEWGTAVLLCEHRTERCLPAADRVLAMVGGELGFDGAPADFLAWTAQSDPALATPAARLFQLAGLRPLPVGVKAARQALAAHDHAVEQPKEGLTPFREERDQAAPKGDGERDSRAKAGNSAPSGPKEGLTPFWRAGWGRRAADRRDALVARDLWVQRDPGDGGRDVLRAVELRVERGERVALMGRNGAGKSTLLAAVAGLIEPVRGKLEVPGGCALLSQSPADYLLRERVADELPGDAGAAALARVGLTAARERDPRDLSGGERQRLALALATAGHDQELGLLCLDEPTRGMDRARKSDLARWIAGLTADGAGALVATHDVEFAAEFADRVLLLGEGTVVADGATAEILSGGWYFATEVARILPASGAVTPEAGAALLRSDRRAKAGQR